MEEISKRLSSMFGRSGSPITDYSEQSAISEISRRPGAMKELSEIETFHKREKKFFPKSLSRLVQNWQQYLDHARQKKCSEPMMARDATYDSSNDP